MTKAETEEATQKVEVELPPGMTEEKLRKLVEKANKPEPVTGDAVVFATIENGYNKQVRVHRTIYKGRELFSVQNFWREDEVSDWQFGKAITFNPEVIQDLIDGLTKMQDWCEENPGK